MRLVQKFLLGVQLYYVLPLRSVLTETISALCTTSKSISAMSQQQQQTYTSSITSTSTSLYESGSASVIFVTTPDENSAKKIAHALITQKLAACVNLIPNLTSIYHWEGKINEDSEILLMIKTKTNRIDELTKFVRENHPYSVAEVISLPIQSGNQPYLDWILKTVPDKKQL